MCDSYSQFDDGVGRTEKARAGSNEDMSIIHTLLLSTGVSGTGPRPRGNRAERPGAPHFSAYAFMGHEQSSAQAPRRVRKKLDTIQYGQSSKKLPLLPAQDPILQHSRTEVKGRPVALNLPGDSRPHPRLTSDTEVEGTSGIAQQGPLPAAGVFSLRRP